jgi:uncharacterized protein with von Willebrand factor type A (vWA) domain
VIAPLSRLPAELRREGIEVSPAEWIDAVRALERVGLDRRDRVRAALRATLVKRAARAADFDRVFDRVFAAPRGAARDGERRRDGAVAREARSGRAGVPQPGAPRGAPRRRDPSPAAPATPRSGERPRARPERRAPRLVVEPSTRDPAAAPPQTVRDGAVPLRRVDLRGRLDTALERELADELARIVARVRLRAGRRRARRSHGELHLRGVFRENLGCEGIPFVLPRRRRRPRRPRVVLLVDVSWSVARAAGLFLSMALATLSRGIRTRVILFVDRPVDSTDEVRRWMHGHPPGAARRRGGGRTIGARPRGVRPGAGIERGAVSFADLLQRIPRLALDAPSDYGSMFHRLGRSPLRPRGRDTVLVVLGDGRTNRFDPQEWSFEELAAGCGAVLWLVPERREEWGSGDSALPLYLPAAHTVVEARDLQGLSRGVAELLRTL